MNKKVVLVVLCVVFAWLVWPGEAERAEEERAAKAERVRECLSSTRDFCGEFWCAVPQAGRLHTWPEEVRVSYSNCLRSCEVTHRDACLHRLR